MITGVVQGDEGRIRLKVKGRGGHDQNIEAVIDTGYTAALTLPPTLIAALDLCWRSVDRGTLADGSECLIDVYEAEIDWDGQIRSILVDEADTAPLVGMTLLRDHELHMQVRDGGKLTIERLP